MDPRIALLAAVTGYLLGAISFTRVVGRKVAPGSEVGGLSLPTADGTETFEGSFVSATTLSVRAGPRAGMAAALLDMLKVFIPTLAFRLLIPEQPYFLIVAVAGVIGHCWPVYYGFKGGRGLSAIYGGMLVIAPVGAIVTAFAGLFLGMILRDAYTTYIGGLWLIIPWLWFATRDWRFLLYGILVNVVFLIASIPDIRQYLDLKRRGISLSYEEGLQTNPMGRGLYKMGRSMKLLRPLPDAGPYGTAMGSAVPVADQDGPETQG
jgi:glycerol-3-phosphate acyltransferase PlsY